MRRRRPVNTKALLVTGAVAALLALFATAMGLGSIFGETHVTHVAPAVLGDRDQLPARSYVEVTATPAPEPWARVAGETTGDPPTWLFTLRGVPRVIVVCPGGDPCASSRARPAPRTFAGRIFDGGDYHWGGESIPRVAVWQMATRDLGLPNDDAVRVLDLSSHPHGSRMSGALGLACCALPLGLLALVALVGGLVLRRRRHGPA